MSLRVVRYEEAGMQSPQRLSPEEVVEWSKRYTIFDWTAQASITPLPVERAEGVYFFGADGKRYLDFNSQLMSVNIGHADRRVVRAITRQAERLPYVNPASMTTVQRALLGKKLLHPRGS
jgi:taurine--2-oxoglutarate transaminase